MNLKASVDPDDDDDDDDDDDGVLSHLSCSGLREGVQSWDSVPCSRFVPGILYHIKAAVTAKPRLWHAGRCPAASPAAVSCAQEVISLRALSSLIMSSN